MAYNFLIPLNLFCYFYICKSYTVNIRADRLVYHHNFNDTLIIYCTLYDEYKYVTPFNITIHHVRNSNSSEEEIGKFISILNDTTIQLKIYNVQHSHSGVYFCANKSANDSNNSVRVRIYVGEKPSIPNFVTKWIDNRSLSGQFEPSLTQIQQNTKIPDFVGLIDFQLSFNIRPEKEKNPLWWKTCDKKETSNSVCILNNTGFYLTGEYSVASYTFFSLRVNVTFRATEFVQIFGYSTKILTYNYADIFEPSAVEQVNITTFARIISLTLPSAFPTWLNYYLYRYRVIWSTSKGILGQDESKEKIHFNLTQLTPNTCYKIRISRRFVELEEVARDIGHWSVDVSVSVCTNMTVPEGPVSWPSFWWRAAVEEFKMWWVPFPDVNWHGDKDFYQIELFNSSSQVVLKSYSSITTYYYDLPSLTTSEMEPRGIAMRACNLVGCSLNRTQQVIPQHDMILPEDLVRFDVEQVNMSDSQITYAIIVFVNFSGFPPKTSLNVSGYILFQNRVINYESSSVNATTKIGSIRLIMSPVSRDATNDFQFSASATNNFQFSASATSTSSSGVLKSTGFVQLSSCVYAALDSSSINRLPPPSERVDCRLDSSCLISFRRIVCEDLTVGRVSFYEVQCVEVTGLAKPATTVATLLSDACRFLNFCELVVVLKKASTYRCKIMAHLHNGQSVVYSDWIYMNTTVVRIGGDDDARFVLIGASVSAGLLALLALVLFGLYKRNSIKQIVECYQFSPYIPNPKSNWSLKIDDGPATEDDNCSIKVTAASETCASSSYSSSGLGSSVGSVSDYFRPLVTVTTREVGKSFSDAGKSAITGYSGSLC